MKHGTLRPLFYLLNRSFLSLIACKSDFLNLIEVNRKAHPFWVPNEVKPYAKRKHLIH